MRAVEVPFDELQATKIESGKTHHPDDGISSQSSSPLGFTNWWGRKGN